MPEKADPMSALRALSDAATPGPWSTDGDDLFAYIYGPDGLHFAVLDRPGSPTVDADAAFIVAAVEYVRAALSGEAPDRDGEVARIAAVLHETLLHHERGGVDNDLAKSTCAQFGWAQSRCMSKAHALYEAGLRAPSLEGARHPEAGETP